MTARSYAAELQAQFASSTDARQLLAWTLGWLAGSFRFKGGSIARLVGDELEIVAAFGQIDEPARRVKLRRGEGIAGNVVATGRTIYSPDLDAPYPVGAAAASRNVGTNRLIRSYLCAPLASSGQVIGVMQIDSDHPSAFGPDDVALFESVAAALSESGALRSWGTER
ncbi:MAG TPA: GAF domain-containing protein [Candidatus Limnocylindria bacterium]|nr:GAF domain-containing protein [Candidatus Limnocylindria bacterium]